MNKHYQVWRNNSPPKVIKRKQSVIKNTFYISKEIRLILTFFVATICLNNFNNLYITIGITLSVNLLMMLFKKEEEK